ncbi:hypothetical protein [Streptomyces litchfieldiae]|uniref:Uncharacterized protein n=1 Tax=Streptomyces litchfieldiae TaxID=3075543 RepID=A0ABU2MRQ3_9ACTN|nr:hypothetical protein [Streptomyces sp. DSM 44938]MDT0344038.1 hypothetical protein [Streptomyces sp. DSM 44938]
MASRLVVFSRATLPEQVVASESRRGAAGEFDGELFGWPGRFAAFRPHAVLAKASDAAE